MFSQMTMFEDLLEAMPDALVVCDNAGVIRYVNGQTELLFGYDRTDLIGTAVKSLVPESLPHVQKVHREGSGAPASASPLGTDRELSGVGCDGTRFPVDISLSPIDTGEGILVIVAVHDMTRYRSEEAEQQRLDRLLAIVEYSDDAIIGTTLDGTARAGTLPPR